MANDNTKSLKQLLDEKQNKLTAGENITIDENNVISATGGGSQQFTENEAVKLKNSLAKNGLGYTEGTNYTVNWNGSIEERDYFEFGSEIKFVKVSEAIPETTMLNGKVTGTVIEGSSQPQSIEMNISSDNVKTLKYYIEEVLGAEVVSGDPTKVRLCYFGSAPIFYLIAEEQASITIKLGEETTTIAIPSAGLYFIREEFQDGELTVTQYTSSMTYGNLVVHQISRSFVPVPHIYQHMVTLTDSSTYTLRLLVLSTNPEGFDRNSLIAAVQSGKEYLTTGIYNNGGVYSILSLTITNSIMHCNIIPINSTPIGPAGFNADVPYDITDSVTDAIL